MARTTKKVKTKKPWITMHGHVEPVPTNLVLSNRGDTKGIRVVFDPTEPFVKVLFDGEKNEPDAGVSFNFLDLDFIGQAFLVMAAELERRGLLAR